jgi:hypothetical protein
MQAGQPSVHCNFFLTCFLDQFKRRYYLNFETWKFFKILGISFIFWLVWMAIQPISNELKLNFELIVLMFMQSYYHTLVSPPNVPNSTTLHKNISLISTYGKRNSLFPLPRPASHWKRRFTQLCTLNCWHAPCVLHRQMGTHSTAQDPPISTTPDCLCCTNSYMGRRLNPHDQTMDSHLWNGYSWLSNEW